MTDGGQKTVLVLGATGMLGHTVLRDFAVDERFRVYGSARSDRLLGSLSASVRDRIVGNVNVEDTDSLLKLFDQVKPDVVVNCIGLVKQLADSNDPLLAVPINTILPHRLARLCAVVSARFVHVSTDCVFDGKKGGYVETDPADAQDLYGRSKHMGEVDYANAITLRTSIIGPELGSAVGLLGWFLKSEGQVSGFNKAVFSGFPTVELSHIIRNHVISRPQMRGLYHVAAAPINKYDLLCLVAQVYGKKIEITPDSKLVIDRSLNADRFNMETGYRPPDWMSLIKKMHAFG
ncbi:dTDP-4-dehydrorhamnose reductase family protein [Bradyrhizobium sp. SYSU BS000235]|uniref:dTDP-4-dehydrorhamnose reductase family protein n=1 Tax=Bradyrhizobium sp. SYSU BS000235 TaxID=3411332 RepID=UPI003C7123C4